MDLDRFAATLAKAEAALTRNADAMAQCAAMLGKAEDRFLEVDARLSAQRFLLEQFLATAFTGNPDGFETFAEGALQRARLAGTIPEPMSAEDREERTVRVATHLSRIAGSVSQRLRKEQEPGQADGQ